jgi:hypothetical protein
MASFNFTSVVLEEGTTFTLGSWVCIADGSGGFNSHLVNPRELEVPAATQRSDLDEFIDNLDEMLLLDLAGEIKEHSIFKATSTRAARRFLRSDPIRSKEQRTRFHFGLHNAAIVYQEVGHEKYM